MTEKMALWTDYEMVVKAIAFIDIVFTSIVSAFVSLFALIMITMPETIQEVLENNQDELEEEIAEIMSKSAVTRTLIIALLWGFWIFALILSVALRFWTINRDSRGLKIWLVINATFALASLPADVLWLVSRGVTVSHVMFLLVIDIYLGFSLWAVFCFIRSIVRGEGEGTHVVEFQAL